MLIPLDGFVSGTNGGKDCFCKTGVKFKVIA
jgi:hypothetical protein